MTRESYKKATELLKRIDEVEKHFLALKYRHSDILAYPFTDTAYPYVTGYLPKETIETFYEQYKSAITSELERLKKEFDTL
jgi:hypothetical protein